MAQDTHDGTRDGCPDPRRGLPAVSRLLDLAAIQSLVERHSRPVVLDAVHEALAGFRAQMGSAEVPPSIDEVVARVAASIQAAEQERLRPVVNATGIVLHTGLGRAVLPRRAVDALSRLDLCCNLQLDIETGLRGKRNYMTERLLCRLSGAEAAMVVNNNAAATLLILAALCKNKEVIVSRGQLIEIGGSYRLPDCVHQSGATLVEVGATNKTHLRDYEAALSERTGAILHVNPSNYRVVGFTRETTLAELAALKSAGHEILLIDDLGCGALIDLAEFGLPHEPTVQESLAAGADLVCFSGDKLIGGPQAGIIVGRRDLIARIKRHPLTRMLRVGKLTDAALEHTLRLFLDPETLVRENPTLRMIARTAPELKRQAANLRRRAAAACPGLRFRVAEDESMTGGGALPATPLPTYVLAVSALGLSAERMAALLRSHEPPVIARVKNDEALLDMRTLLPGEERIVLDALRHVAASLMR